MIESLVACVVMYWPCMLQWLNLYLYYSDTGM